MDSNLMELNVQVNERRFIDEVNGKYIGRKYKTRVKEWRTAPWTATYGT